MPQGSKAKLPILPYHRILLICIGNICRSPMAATMLEYRLLTLGITGIEVRSAGISAMLDHPADPLAQRLMREQGLDISRHQAQQVNAALVTWADLILTMDLEQCLTLERLYPDSHGKLQRLGKFNQFDIPDPYGCSYTTFKHTLELITIAITAWTIAPATI